MSSSTTKPLPVSNLRIASDSSVGSHPNIHRGRDALAEIFSIVNANGGLDSNSRSASDLSVVPCPEARSVNPEPFVYRTETISPDFHSGVAITADDSPSRFSGSPPQLPSALARANRGASFFAPVNPLSVSFIGNKQEQTQQGTPRGLYKVPTFRRRQSQALLQQPTGTQALLRQASTAAARKNNEDAKYFSYKRCIDNDVVPVRPPTPPRLNAKKAQQLQQQQQRSNPGSPVRNGSIALPDGPFEASLNFGDLSPCASFAFGSPDATTQILQEDTSSTVTGNLPSGDAAGVRLAEPRALLSLRREYGALVRRVRASL